MKTQKALDEKWYQRFEELCSFEPYEYLGGELAKRAHQKKMFFEGKIENPRLDLPYLDVSQFLQKQIQLSMFEKELVENESNQLVKEAYILKLSEKKAEVNLLLASAERNMKAFQAYNEILYGKPSPEVFQTILHIVHEFLDQMKSNPDSSVQKNIKLIMQRLPKESSSHNALKITNAILERARKATYEELGILVETIPDNQVTPSKQEIIDIFRTALDLVGAKDWTIEIDIHNTKFNTNQEKKIITIPKHRSISYETIRRLIWHEVGTHIKRRVMGRYAPLKLLSIGLHEYQSGEEGIATMREQVIAKEFKIRSRVGQYLAICLATGVDGRTRNFREVFEILRPYFYIKHISKGIQKNEAEIKADETTWNITSRVFRGTTCEARGVCLTKDKIYFEGNYRIWKLIEKDSDEIKRFSAAKYDPTKKDHIEILNKLSIALQ